MYHFIHKVLIWLLVQEIRRLKYGIFLIFHVLGRSKSQPNQYGALISISMETFWSLEEWITNVNYMMFLIKRKDIHSRDMLIQSILSNSQNSIILFILVLLIRQSVLGTSDLDNLLIHFMVILLALIVCSCLRMKIKLFLVIPKEQCFLGMSEKWKNWGKLRLESIH